MTQTNEIKVLDLPLKSQWYLLIELGEKREEYREIKPYWEKRLLDYKKFGDYADDMRLRRLLFGIPLPTPQEICKNFPRGYTHVRFRYGYTKRTMTFECEGITIGQGREDWGAPKDTPVFIIKLGRRIA